MKGLFLLLWSYQWLSAVSVPAFTAWTPYVTPLVIPPIVDVRQGGEIVLVIRQFNHTLGGGMNLPTPMYGIAKSQTDLPTYPGPIILAKSKVSIKLTWSNELDAPHVLDSAIEPSLVGNKKLFCYPNCGVPTVMHTIGLKVSSKNDGNPYMPVGKGESATYHIGNAQDGGSLYYHDQFVGMTRLNVYSGLLGAYIIQDDLEKSYNLLPDCDIPLIIQDKQVGTDGLLKYPGMTLSDACPARLKTKWVPGSFGNVNLVNGIAYPYVTVPRAQCRLRLFNGSGSRLYSLNLLTFYQNCKMIAKGSNRLAAPAAMTLAYKLYPLSRVDLICDFSSYANGAVFNVTNSDTTHPTGANGNPAPVMQFRVSSPSVTAPRPIASVLNDALNLRTLWLQSNGITRNFTLVQNQDSAGCSTMFGITDNANTRVIKEFNRFECIKGTVEKWNFMNSMRESQSVGWRIGLGQCGPDEYSNALTELREAAQVPTSYPNKGVVTYVCYVACTPAEYIKASTHNTTDPTQFPFFTGDPYLLQANHLEKQDNHMIAWLYLKSDPSTFTSVSYYTSTISSASGFEASYAPVREVVTIVLFASVLTFLLFLVRC